jgi:hypothetical protein
VCGERNKKELAGYGQRSAAELDLIPLIFGTLRFIPTLKKHARKCYFLVSASDIIWYSCQIRK